MEARRFAPDLHKDDVRESKQNARAIGICFKSMAEANKVRVGPSSCLGAVAVPECSH